MREVVTLQIGECGNQIGKKFWETICGEHGVSPTGVFCGKSAYELKTCDVFFSESIKAKYVPRALLVDLDPSSLDSIRCSPFGQLFAADNFIFGRCGSGNNFGKGRYTEGLDIMDIVLDSVRHEVEQCDLLQGFQIIHSLGGGTGSGIGSLVLERFQDEYPDQVVTTYSVLPSNKVSNAVVEPYNTVLAMPQLITGSTMAMTFDNEALYNVCSRVLNLEKPMLEDLNNIVSNVITGVTASVRFPGIRNGGLRKLKNSLVPFPRCNFFIPGFAPLCSRGVQSYRTFNVQDIMYQIYEAEACTLLATCNPKCGKYLTNGVIFRGRVSPFWVEKCICRMKQKNPESYVDWLAGSMKHIVSNIPPKGLKISATVLANNTCILETWKRIQSKYYKLFNDKTYLHWYGGEGVMREDFEQANAEFTNIIAEYQMYHDIRDNEDEEEEAGSSATATVPAAITPPCTLESEID